MKLIPLKRVDLKAHPQLNEAWLQDQIAEDPNFWDYQHRKGRDRFRFHSVESLQQAAVFQEFLQDMLDPKSGYQT